jgi:hypothetical protein
MSFYFPDKKHTEIDEERNEIKGHNSGKINNKKIA